MCANESTQTLSALNHAIEKYSGFTISRVAIKWGKQNDRWAEPIKLFSLCFLSLHRPPTFEEWQSLYKIMEKIMKNYGNENKDVYVQVICDWERETLEFQLNVKNVDPDEMAEIFN